MGTPLGHEDERPPHRVFVDRCELGVCPVTRAEYESFVDTTSHEPPRDWSHPAFAHADSPSWAAAGFMRLRIAHGDPRKTGARSGYRPKPSGNSPRVGDKRRSSRVDVMPEWIPNGGRGPWST